MRLFRFASLLMVFSLALAACAPGQLTAEQIMERMQAARDNLKAAHTVANIVMDSPDRDGSFTVEAWAEKTNQTDAAGQPIAKLRAKVLSADSGEDGPDLAGTEFVNDGETFWLYNPAENKVITGKLSELKNGAVGAQDPTAQMMRMQEVLQQIIDGANVSLEGEEQVAERAAWKIKLTPKPETQQQLQIASVINTNLWIDQETDLPVKVLIEVSDIGSVEAAATKLELSDDIADDVFAFTPPAGAEVINAAELVAKARPQVTTLDDARNQLSFDVLSPSSLPEGVQLDEVQILNMRGETLVQNFSGPVSFSLVQGKGDLPGLDQAPDGAQAQQVTVRGQQATLITSGGGSEQGALLRWQENGVTVVVAGTLSAEQVTAIAESLQ